MSSTRKESSSHVTQEAQSAYEYLWGLIKHITLLRKVVCHFPKSFCPCINQVKAAPFLLHPFLIPWNQRKIQSQIFHPNSIVFYVGDKKEKECGGVLFIIMGRCFLQPQANIDSLVKIGVLAAIEFSMSLRFIVLTHKPLLWVNSRVTYQTKQ